jgi:hypothetical protein
MEILLKGIGREGVGLERAGLHSARQPGFRKMKDPFAESFCFLWIAA